MKYIISLALFAVLSAPALSQSLITTALISTSGDYVPTALSLSLYVPTGKILDIIYCSEESSDYLRYYVINSGTPPAPINLLNGVGKLVGPGVFYAQNPTVKYIVLTYRLLDNIDSSTTTIPTSAVVIPTDATGPVNVILESSTDLVTWTQANPGTYGASTTKRFFRVRAVNQ